MVDLREVLNAIRYMEPSAGGLRMLPVYFGPWQTIVSKGTGSLAF